MLYVLILIFPLAGDSFPLLIIPHGDLLTSQLLWGDAIEIVLEPALGLSVPSTFIYSELAKWSPSASP